jgi:hypothetical protein
MTAWSDRCLLERDSKDVDWVAGMCSIRLSNGVGRVPVEYLRRMLLQESMVSLWKTIPNWAFWPLQNGVAPLSIKPKGAKMRLLGGRLLARNDLAFVSNTS